QHWTEMARRDLEARIVAYLQRAADGKVPITERLVRDVIVNLTGMCSTYPSTLQLPILRRGDSTCVPSPYIACKNGLLNLGKATAKGRMPQLVPFTPRQFSTMALGFEYDLDARCPLWEQTLLEVLPPVGDDNHRIDVLQELFGWTLAPPRL